MPRSPIPILLKTTISSIEDDWNIDRFSLLRDHLSSLKDGDNKTCEVTARDRDANGDGNDTLLSVLDTTEFDELWLFAVDRGNGLSVSDCQGPLAFVSVVVGFWQREIIRISDRLFAH